MLLKATPSCPRWHSGRTAARICAERRNEQKHTSRRARKEHRAGMLPKATPSRRRWKQRPDGGQNLRWAQKRAEAYLSRSSQRTQSRDVAEGNSKLPPLAQRSYGGQNLRSAQILPVDVAEGNSKPPFWRPLCALCELCERPFVFCAERRFRTDFATDSCPSGYRSIRCAVAWTEQEKLRRCAR